ncbi:unnamed protein product [Rhizophagus irregularis]|nr:unnamed protein product [Rhizophagus irregularis]
MLSQIPLLIPLLRFIIKLDEIFTKKFPGMIVSSKLGNFPLDIIPREKETSMVSKRVIAYYEQGHSKRSTADKFEIEPKQLRNWLKNKDQLMIVAPYVRKLVQGARPKYQQLKTELIEWFRDS